MTGRPSRLVAGIKFYVAGPPSMRVCAAVLCCVLPVAALAGNPDQTACASRARLALQVLGSGGPDGRGPFPALDDFLVRLFGSAGPFAYLGGALDGSGGQFALTPAVVPSTPGARQLVVEHDGARVEAIGVRHGPVPALGYRIAAAGRTIVFIGDQDGATSGFWEAATDADLLVAPLAIPDASDPVASALHATPARIARGAARAGVKHLLLVHLMHRSLLRLDAALAGIRALYAGPVTVADDLLCLPLA